jgi:predicted O-methyltransferase YrrM
MVNILHEKYLDEMKQYAEYHSVPIMQEDGLNYILDYIKKNNVLNILEIGTAIGYSAINMALCNDKINVTTIEKDRDRYLEAIKNTKKFFLEDRITLLFNDALNVKFKDKFDLIFIDAAKGQYTNFFNLFKDNLTEKGVIITDNIYFHGLVEGNDDIKNRNLRGLINKIRSYVDFLKENKQYTTDFIKLGDGLAITRKKGKEEEIELIS